MSNTNVVSPLTSVAIYDAVPMILKPKGVKCKKLFQHKEPRIRRIPPFFCISDNILQVT
jgi:hypothetical protein